MCTAEHELHVQPNRPGFHVKYFSVFALSCFCEVTVNATAQKSWEKPSRTSERPQKTALNIFNLLNHHRTCSDQFCAQKSVRSFLNMPLAESESLFFCVCAFLLLFLVTQPSIEMIKAEISLWRYLSNVCSHCFHGNPLSSSEIMAFSVCYSCFHTNPMLYCPVTVGNVFYRYISITN